MNKILALASVSAVLGLSACASSDATVVRMSNVWSTTCGGSGQGVVVSAKTLAEFHAAVEKTPECARGYVANAPSN
ncbi:hypothetical protein [Rhodospirillum rubrum]|uniref:Lipoprotein n=1 Tax=Rhodospirillum rubrum (strain ATCC 11170 / ATH 1.1.1 / DSM 467 / LMG 4362 / NCIMB 8255 / S1) TaxID=269796 RepID=Q2RQN8_RHORT|nr:hypothetical protein [Rhodospirillum rubrum]ABC23557.1 hypothetical protein Rru_A2760 [Rhodospirillum rubrum ATCC 11170]AEO49295.1 hypothetical protein F11_14165 [Rhodospirillum rubrum F11]MBK5955231.1 hypothetical protein [Rhodospirillum rubrum]QXG79523.1 hypothetical protein KUL73_14230 [Rhodospirillum rubrum]HAP99928.1 hypothetical protein [Rhodospirillum rubrum]